MLMATKTECTCASVSERENIVSVRGLLLDRWNVLLDLFSVLLCVLVVVGDMLISLFNMCLLFFYTPHIFFGRVSPRLLVTVCFHAHRRRVQNPSSKQHFRGRQGR